MLDKHVVAFVGSKLAILLWMTFENRSFRPANTPQFPKKTAVLGDLKGSPHYGEQRFSLPEGFLSFP